MTADIGELVPAFTKEFPAFAFTTQQTSHGPSLVAERKPWKPGALYVVVTSDPGEMRRILTAAMAGMPRIRNLYADGPRLGRPESEAVGRNVRALRMRNGWTLAKLGAELGYVPSEMCRRESGERLFREGDVLAITRLFGVTRAQLIAACVGCYGEPPIGFACLTCGAEGR